MRSPSMARISSSLSPRLSNPPAMTTTTTNCLLASCCLLAACRRLRTLALLLSRCRLCKGCVWTRSRERPRTKENSQQQHQQGKPLDLDLRGPLQRCKRRRECGLDTPNNTLLLVWIYDTTHTHQTERRRRRRLSHAFLDLRRPFDQSSIDRSKCISQLTDPPAGQSKPGPF